MTTAPPTTDTLPDWHPLSDRLRWAKVTALTTILAALGVLFAWQADRAHVDVSEMDADPTAHLGERVMLGNFKVTAIEGECADLWSPWAQVTACPIPADLELGHPVSMSAVYRGEGRVEATTWRIHRQLWIKKVVGLSALMLTVGLVGWDLRRRGRA